MIKRTYDRVPTPSDMRKLGEFVESKLDEYCIEITEADRSIEDANSFIWDQLELNICGNYDYSSALRTAIINKSNHVRKYVYDLVSTRFW